MNPALFIGMIGAVLIAAMLGALFEVRRRRARFSALREQRYNVLESIPDGLFILNNQLRFTHVNECAERLLRKDATKLIGTRLDGVLDPLASELMPDIHAARRNGHPLEKLHYFRSSQTWVEVRIQPARDELLVYLRDVTERKHAEAFLSESERRIRLLLHQVPAVLWTVDRNLRFTSVVGSGLSSQALVEGQLMDKPFEELLDPHDHLAEKSAAILRVLEGESTRFEARRADRWLQHHVEPLRDVDGSIVGAIGVALDITEIKEGSDYLARLARQDVMTGLPNRLALEETLLPLLHDARERSEKLAVLFLDIDRFKTINDTMGHRAGDEILRAISKRLRHRLSDADLIFRPGGDEFIIVIRNLQALDSGEDASCGVMGALAEPFAVEGREMFVTASIGTSIFPDNGTTAEELLKQADSAMYRAKAAGRNNVQYYDGTMHETALHRLRLEQDLRKALSRNELRLVLQPIIDTNSKSIVAAEALLRWAHPTLGDIPPDVFIPIAEETGIIVPISHFVIREACQLAALYRALGNPTFRIAVNLSARDFYEPTLPAFLAGCVTASNLTPDALDIEVTESVLVNETALKTLGAVRDMGFRIIMDDFGIGYSSLSYIKRLPISAVKIDKSFIRDVTRSSYDQAIVKAITTLAQSLDFSVIAEGIEYETQHQFIKTVFCGQAQGFYFSEPLEVAQFQIALSTQSIQKRVQPKIAPQRLVAVGASASSS
ncbi:MAG: EAL domain-containing protein [Candidatus Eremiobacteraeota bacterium]|nr:EAL domain-containing protein [Candidatus Eremiobacteraeota bacterium]